jgi:hypothetical protein
MADEDSKVDEIDDLRHKVFHNEKMKEERAISDAKYADKLVEKIVFGMCAFILISVIGAIVTLVVR